MKNSRKPLSHSRAACARTRGGRVHVLDDLPGHVSVCAHARGEGLELRYELRHALVCAHARGEGVILEVLPSTNVKGTSP